MPQATAPSSYGAEWRQLQTRELTSRSISFFFFNDTATTEIYTLSLHDALPISVLHRRGGEEFFRDLVARASDLIVLPLRQHVVGTIERHHALHLCRRCGMGIVTIRSEEHTSELQSLRHLVCRLLLEKKK